MAAPPDSCPDEHALSGYATGGLTADAHARITAHVERCARCLELVGALAELDETKSGSDRAPPRLDAQLHRGRAVGRYLVLQKIGGGAMGWVYAAYDPQLHRRVALKVIHPSYAEGLRRDDAQARLLREAQSMARLSHPAVLSVFDAGTFGGQVFLAMELVEGSTLRQWLLERHRPAEVLELFSRAGAGLAAAHRAGLLHRDFKPENVLLDAAGQPKVTDFGLAQPLQGERAREDAPSAGTPAYMSPEQAAGAALDARSDQFSFCVALYEALYGQRPFPERELGAVRQRLTGGPPLAVPPGGGVGAQVRKALARGLSLTPQARFADMEALLQALGRPAALRSRWRAGLAAGAALVGVALLGGVSLRGRPPCDGFEERLSGVWDAAAKARGRQAFLATGVPYALDVWQRLESGLDGYARGWVTARRGACLAARVEKVEPEPVYAARAHCLDSRLRELSAVLEVVARLDEKAVRGSASPLEALRPVTDCEREQVLRAPAVPKEDAAALEKVEDAVARARARYYAGLYDDALEQLPREEAPAGPAFARARALGKMFEGLTLVRKGRYPEAETAYHQGLLAAEAVGDASLAAQLWVSAGWLFGVELRRQQDGRRAAEHAAAWLQRAPEHEREEVHLANLTAVLEMNEDHYAESARHYERALAVDDRARVLSEGMRANLLNNYGAVLAHVGRFEQAVKMYQAAIAARERASGVNHPSLAAPLNNLGNTLSGLARPEEALAVQRRALALREAALGADNPDVAKVLSHIAFTLLQLDRREEAEEASRRAYEIRQRTGTLEAGEGIVTVAARAGALLGVKRADEARALCERGVEVTERQYGPKHHRTGQLLGCVGEAQLAQGRDAEAAKTLERAMAILTGVEIKEHERSEVRLHLARALLRLPPRRDEGLRMAAELLRWADGAEAVPLALRRQLAALREEVGATPPALR